MCQILVVYHSQGGHTRQMAQAVTDGARSIEGVTVTMKRAAEAVLEDLLSCDGLVIGSPEYFGYMAGAIKDLFDRTYQKLENRTARLPFVLFVSAGNDGIGARTNIERIIRGFRWRKVAEPIIVKGRISASDVSKLEELGQTLAAGLKLGIY